MNQNAEHFIVNGETSLGIEFGSTRIKAALIDENLTVLASGSYEWENQFIGGYWTYSVDQMLKGLQAAYFELKQNVEKTYGVKLRKIGSVGCSAMMQGYIVLDKDGELLTPFRTWRNATTARAATELTAEFRFKIPQRWSIAHLYQAILDNEAHVDSINFITTLSGYVHWLLTGERVLGICDASGMFPIDETTKQFDEQMLARFADLTAHKNYNWQLSSILPKVCIAGEQAGCLHQSGALLLDPSGELEAGIPLCPPEGDAGTGMVATNSIQQRTGNVSAGTSIFAMLVLDKDLSAVYEQIDIITTPVGDPVAMVLANNGSSDINAWVRLFSEFCQAMGIQADSTQIFNTLFTKALDADDDGGALLSYGYYSAENLTGFAQGRPIFIRSADSNFTLANFIRMHLFSAFAALRIGIDILTEKERISIDHITAHGGLFKTPGVGQRMCAAALNVPVSLMPTAGEAGAWGMAVLARYMADKNSCSLADYLSENLPSKADVIHISPIDADVNGFNLYLKRYKEGLPIQKAAIEHFQLINTASQTGDA